jgi:HEAT repeat protein
MQGFLFAWASASGTLLCTVYIPLRRRVRGGSLPQDAQPRLIPDSPGWPIVDDAVGTAPAVTVPGALRATELALESMTDAGRFEDLAVLALQGLEPSLRPTGGPGDRQRDAVAGSLRTDDDRLVMTVSLQRTWAQKVGADLEGLRKSGDPLPEAVVAVTNRRTSARKRNELQRAAPDRYGFRLRVYDQHMLALRLLRPELLHVREEILGLNPPSPPVAVEADVYRTLLASTGSQVDRLYGRDSVLGDVLAVIDKHHVVAVLGPGGIGKTRLVLAAAEQLSDRRVLFLDDRSPLTGATLPSELAGSDQLVLVVDNAHRRADLRQLLGLLARRTGPVTLVLVARDGFMQRLEDALEGSPLGTISSEATVALAPMSNASIADMVRSAKPALEYGGAIDVIVDIARGNPLIALLAHGVAAAGGSLDQLGRDEVLADHARSLVRSVQTHSVVGDGHEFGELLALIAALSWLGSEETAVLEAVSKLLDIPLARLRRMLVDIADSGLLTQQGDRFAITPDLLAGHLLWSSFFARERPIALRYRAVWDAFAPTTSDRLCAALGGLPSEAVSADDVEAAYVAESLRELAQRDAGSALARVQSLAPGLPWLAVRVVDDALDHLPDDAEARSRALLAASEALQRTPTFSEGWPRQLAVVAALFAGNPDPESIKTVEEHLTGVYKRVPVDRGPGDAYTLASVQAGLADLTLSFWSRRRSKPGTAEAAAIAARQLLTVTFSTTFMSPEDDRRVILRGFCLPASSWTKKVLMAGSQLLVEALPELPVRRQLKAIDATENVRHAACGYRGPFGAEVGEGVQSLAGEVLDDLRARLRPLQEHLPLVVRSVIEDTFGPLWPEDGDLAEYRELLAARRDIYDPEVRVQRATALAERLMQTDDSLALLRRWSGWLSDTTTSGVRDYAPWVVGDALQRAAERDPETVGHLLDALMHEPGPLIPRAVGALSIVIDRTQDGDQRATAWARSQDPELRATVAAALRDAGGEDRVALLRKLATDTETRVRDAVVSSLSFGGPFDSGGADVGLLACEPDSVEQLGVLLDHFARRHPDDPVFAFSPRQMRKVRAITVAAAQRERLDGYLFARIFESLREAAPRLAIECARERIRYLRSVEGDASFSWAISVDGLPKEFASAVRCSAKASDVRWVLDQMESTPAHGVVKGAQRELLEWIDDGTQVTARLGRWLASDNERLRYDATVVLDNPLSAEAFRARAAALLSIEPPLDIDDDLVQARDPKFWSGSRVPRWEQRRKEFAEWVKDPNERLAAVGRAGVAFYKRLVEQGDPSMERWQT